LHDPEADRDQLHAEYGLTLTPLKEMQPADAVVVAVAHSSYRDQGWDLIKTLINPSAFVADVPALLDRAGTPEGVILWRL